MFAILLAVAVGTPDPVAGCVWIRAENDSSGSGFVVDAKKRWIVTCRHVVGDRDRVDVYFPWMRDGRLVVEKSSYLANRDSLRETNRLVSAKVIRKSDEADLALLEADAIPESVTPLSLAAQAARVGDSVRAVGCRNDLDTLFNRSFGTVRQSGRLANGYPWRGKKLATGADVVLAQLPIEEGDSGGPALDDAGEVVGMISALRRQAPLAAVAISAREIRRFLNVQEPKPAPANPGAAEALTRATVWLRPTATDVHLAGVLIDSRHVLTSARGLGPVGVVGIAFPIRENGRWVGEREPYRDAVGLALRKSWSPGVVLARDPHRDLALVALEEGSLPTDMKPLPLAANDPRPGDAIRAVSHPGGVEFAWVHSSGAVRQVGRLPLAEGEAPAKVGAALFQLPAQAASPGGPIVNDRGELVGVLSMRESNQQAGYAATPAEIATFLGNALPHRQPAWMSFTTRLANDFANSLAHRANERPLEEREWLLQCALLLDEDAFSPRSFLWNTLMKLGRVEEAEAVLDRGVERNTNTQTTWLGVRAVRRMIRKEWRGARGDLERVLEVTPLDANARRSLVRTLLELNKDDEAAAAVKDAVRVQVDGYRYLAADLLEQAADLEKKFPGAPAIPADWLAKALAAAAKGESNDTRRTACEAILKAATFAKEDAARLKILREFLARPLR